MSDVAPIVSSVASLVVAIGVLILVMKIGAWVDSLRDGSNKD